jgi:hypothetical protein
MEDLLNAGIHRMITEMAIRRLHYVDTATALAGGELCETRAHIYMNALNIRHPNYSFHPTERGQGQLAKRLAHGLS